MRELIDHIVPGDSANQQLKIEVTDEPGPGGANCRYEISGFDCSNNPSKQKSDLIFSRSVVFQNGSVKEVGINGSTNEAELAILIDRMRGFQKGKFVSRENAIALTHLEEALNWLMKRTINRIRRGVEGTHEL